MSELRLDDGVVRGVVALVVAPGTRARDRDRMLDAALGDQLHAMCAQLGVVLGAAPSAFAWAREGKKEEGKTIFDVCARVEGDRLVPHRKGISR